MIPIKMPFVWYINFIFSIYISCYGKDLMHEMRYLTCKEVNFYLNTSLQRTSFNKNALLCIAYRWIANLWPVLQTLRFIEGRAVEFNWKFNIFSAWVEMLSWKVELKCILDRKHRSKILGPEEG